MDVKAVKDKILQLAIQGKLVKQNLNDEPASALLEKIKVEKKKSIEDNKIKKEIPLQDIKDEEKPFELPIGWQWVRLGEISEYIQRGKSPKYSDVEMYPVIAQKCVQWSGVSLGKALFIEPDSITKYGKERFLVHGDLLWNSTGTGSCGRIGKFTDSIRNGFDKIVADSHITVIRCFKQYINYEYLFIWLSSPEVQSVIESKASGSTNQIELATSTIKNYLISLPPLEEQRRIVEKVNESFSFVDELDNNRQDFFHHIADSKNKILQLAIQGKLVEQREEDEPASVLLERVAEEKERLIKEKKIKKEKPLPEITEEEKTFDLPKGWEWVRLGRITQFLGGYAFKSNKYIEHSMNQIIRLGNVKNSNLILAEKQVFISDEDAENANLYKIKVDDVLVTMTGTKGKRDYFFTCIVEQKHLEDIKLYLNQRVGCIRTNNKIISKYLNYILKSDIQLDNIFKFETGTANQGNLGAEVIKNLVVPLPPLTEQNRLVNKLDMIMEYLDSLQEEIES